MWYIMGTWQVDLSYIRDWLATQDKSTITQVIAAIEVLAEQGPALRRPYVGSIRGSKYQAMKELRPGSSGSSEIRILFMFDPKRSAIMLLAGDKSGQWEKWYKRAIPEAERRYEEHLKRMGDDR